MRRALIGGLLVVSLTAGLAASASATFPGQNGRIAFVRDNASPMGSIFLVDPDGQNQVQISDGAGVPDVNPSPSFSPDGERIAFSHFVDGDNEIFVMAANGANPVQLTDNGFEDANPAFTPDGRRIVFSSRAINGPDFEIVVMDADGANPSALTDNAANDFQPSTSVDGRIVFTRSPGVASEIVSMDADGQNQVPLTPGGDDEVTPSFSPDGRRIIFARGDGIPREIFVMDADGQNATPLTANGFNNLYPSFSPDGQRIVFTTFASGGADIAIMDASEGSPATTLVGGYGIDYWTNWQPLNAPVLDVTAGQQKSPRHVTATVVCQNENATVTIDGSLKAAKPKAAGSKSKPVELDAVTLQLEPGVPATVEIPVVGKGRKLIKSALKAGRKPKGAITATATDDLDASSSDSQDVKYKKKKKGAER